MAKNEKRAGNDLNFVGYTTSKSRRTTTRITPSRIYLYRPFAIRARSLSTRCGNETDRKPFYYRITSSYAAANRNVP